MGNNAIVQLVSFEFNQRYVYLVEEIVIAVYHNDIIRKSKENLQCCH